MNDQQFGRGDAPAGGGAGSKGPRLEVFSFTGTAGEYFRIWIVNLFLTIVTLGLYSPWAKVRRLKYFYGNTWLDGHNFDYVADPKRILIGRLIVVGVLIAVNLLVNISPFFAVLFLPYIFGFPWLINKSMAFNARMTVYRNVRFGFQGSYGGAFKTFTLWPIGAYFTAFILSPFMFRAWGRYIGSNTRWGRAHFKTMPGVGPYYANLGRTILVIGVPVVALLALTVFVMVGSGLADTSSNEPSGLAVLVGSVSTLLTYGLMAGAFFYHAAGVRNIAFNNTLLDGKHLLKSRLGRGRYLWIMVTNLIATILSLGLLRAWAAVRTWRYLADHTALEIEGDLDTIIDATQAEGNVAAAEYFDIEGIDFGL